MTQNEYLAPKILDCMHYVNVMHPGEKIFFRTVRYYEIDINLTGERTMWLNDQRYDVTAGSVICRVPGQRVGTLGNYNMYLLTLDFCHRQGEDRPAADTRPKGISEERDPAGPNAVSSYYWQTLPTIFQPAHRAELLKMYERLSLIWRQPDRKQETDDLLAALLHLLLADAFLNRMTEEKDDSPVSSAVTFLQEHYAEKITLDDLAKEAALNKSYLIRLFKKEMGTTPIGYLNHIRLSAAKNLLVNSGAPIKVIADRCGYENPAYFVSRFRLAFGLTPEEYRNENRKHG